MGGDGDAGRTSDLRAEIEAARRELAETAEALAARSTPQPPAASVEIVPASANLPVPYRRAASPRRRVAVGVALGLAALLLRRLAR